jgi:hypothetical protein
MKIAGPITFAAALAISTSSAAQVTSIETDRPASLGRDPNRMICEIYETTGTRLGARKVCKTALEWQQLRDEQRQTVEMFEQKNTSVGCQTGNPCSGGLGPQ